MSNGDYKFFMERAVSHALAGNIAGMCRVAINRLRKNVPQPAMLTFSSTWKHYTNIAKK